MNTRLFILLCKEKGFSSSQGYDTKVQSVPITQTIFVRYDDLKNKIFFASAHVFN